MTVALNELKQLWLNQGLPANALEHIQFTAANPPLLPSSFAVSQVAQASIAAAALAAAEIYRHRSGHQQTVKVDLNDAERECSAYFTIDGREPESWAEYSGVYPCCDGYIRVHANFDHHRDIFLRTLGFEAPKPSESKGPSRQQIETVLEQWDAQKLEDTINSHGGIVAKLRDFKEWDQHPQARAMEASDLFSIEKIAECPPVPLTPFSSLYTESQQQGNNCSDGAEQRPLGGIRVLDLTRILAGPVGTRTLAAYGADVMTVNSPFLPNIEHIIDTGRGKRSCHIDLDTDEGRETLRSLISNTDIFVQGYRPGSLENKGFDAQTLASLKPGIIYTSLSAFGEDGPWAEKRGFDSIVQSATGFNFAEAQAGLLQKTQVAPNTTKPLQPRALPVQILDFAAGFLIAYASQVALLRRTQEGGSWHVKVSLLQTANWLRAIGQKGFDADQRPNDFSTSACDYASEYGLLKAMPHAAKFSATPPRFDKPSVTPGTHPASWDKEK